MSKTVPLQRTIAVGERPDAATQRFHDFWTAYLGRGGWALQPAPPNQITYLKTDFHTWQIVVAVLLFPIGMLALLAEKEKLWISATFSPQGDGATNIAITGVIPGGKLPEQLAHELDRFDPAALTA